MAKGVFINHWLTNQSVNVNDKLLMINDELLFCVADTVSPCDKPAARLSAETDDGGSAEGERRRADA